MTTRSETETDETDEAARAIVLQGLDDYNIAALKDAGRMPIRVFSRDESGQVFAGAIGFSLGKWAFLGAIWVAPEKRGEGLGARLLQEVEAVGRERNCEAVFLDTYKFQAPGFYLRHGYEIVLQLPNDGALTRYFLRKNLV